RVGYAFNHWLLYATAGVAWSLGRFLQTPGVVDDTDKVLHLHTGWAVGAGAELAVAPRWMARVEYLYLNFCRADVAVPSYAAAGGSSYGVHTIRVGLSHKLRGPDFPAGVSNPVNSSQTQFANWEIHGQTTYIQQGYPPFHSPYLGQNSFTPWAQTRSTWTAG